MTNFIEFSRTFNIKVVPKITQKYVAAQTSKSSEIVSNRSSYVDENSYSPYNDPDSEFFIDQFSSSDEDTNRTKCARNRSTSWIMTRPRKGGGNKRKRSSNYPRLNIKRVNISTEGKILSRVEAIKNSAQPRATYESKRTFGNAWTALRSAVPRSVDTAGSKADIECELNANVRHSSFKRNSSSNENGNVQMNWGFDFDWCAQTTATSHLSSQVIETPTQPTQVEDLLQNSTLDTQQTKPRKVTPKRYRRGGFLEQLQLAIQSSKSDKTFLDYDKKFGLAQGLRLIVRQLEVCCGVQMAKVQMAGTNETVNIVIGVDLQRHVHVGTQLEAYFQCDSPDYIIKKRGKCDEPFYVKPHRLILVQ